MSKSHKKRQKKRHAERAAATTAITQNNNNGPSKRAQRAYADLAARDPRFKILYFIPHFPQDLREASIFGWYSPAMLQAARPLMTIATWPADIREPFSEQQSVLVNRLTRRIWPKIIPVELDALYAGAHLFDNPFRVFASNEPAVANEIDAFITHSGWHCLHISSIEGNGRILLENFTINHLLNYFKSVVDTLSTDAKWASFARIAKKEIDPKHLRMVRSHQLPIGAHNVTYPNEFALSAFGWELHRNDPISKPLTMGGGNPQQYVDRICRSAKAVRLARSHLVPSELCDYRFIIAVQSMYWGHFTDWRYRIPNSQEVDNKTIRLAYGLTVQATTYFDHIEVSDGKDNLLNNPIFKFFQAQRKNDANSFTAGLTILAAASLAPVLRLEPKLNQIRGDLKQFANCVRSKSHHHFDWKQSRMASRLCKKMRTLINPSFLALIDKPEHGSIEGLKLVTDLPLELMHSRGVPLSMRFDVSRLPVMPGSLYLANCIMPPVILPMEAFSDVLVIRSFQPEDPLHGMLEISISAILKMEPNPTFGVKVRFVDVVSEDELILALEEFKGALMIFDGHGYYDSEIGAGTIVIGGKGVDIWRLRKRCTFPPIVIFSACDTQPLDGSHSSSATAAFVLGAHTILGSTLPIDGMKAGAFIGRLLLRISEFLPLAVRYKRFFTWREMVSGLLRMTHVTEVMAALKKNAGLAYQVVNFDPVQMRANTEINERRPNWYDAFLCELSTISGKSIHELKSDIEKWASMTDSMKYVQLGNPESIIIVEEDPSKVLLEESVNNGGSH